MKFHEVALQIATSADSLPLQIKAASRLTHVYQVAATLFTWNPSECDPPRSGPKTVTPPPPHSSKTTQPELTLLVL
eukprot:820821-Amphidinium_carterae.1